MLNLTPSVPVMIDFGIDSLNHYRALNAVLFYDNVDELQTAKQVYMALHNRILALDEALGDGLRLNALVKTYAPQYADSVQFIRLLK